jgi:hypothetical protein
MKVLSNYILEKLKVSKDDYITNKEFYETFVNHRVPALDLQRVYHISRLIDFPVFEFEADSFITRIEVPSDFKGILAFYSKKTGDTRNFKFTKYIFTSNEDQPVDFISLQDAKKILDYINENY